MSKFFTTNRPLEDVIQRDFQSLLKKEGFTQVSFQDLPQFHDGVAVYRSQNYSLRIVRDRGCVILQLAPPMDAPAESDWKNLDSLVEFLVGDASKRERDQVNSFEEENARLSRLLGLHRNELAAFFQVEAWPQNKQSIDKILQEKLEERIRQVRERNAPK